MGTPDLGDQICNKNSNEFNCPFLKTALMTSNARPGPNPIATLATVAGANAVTESRIQNFAPVAAVRGSTWRKSFRPAIYSPRKRRFPLLKSAGDVDSVDAIRPERHIRNVWGGDFDRSHEFLVIVHDEDSA